MKRIKRKRRKNIERTSSTLPRILSQQLDLDAHAAILSEQAIKKIFQFVLGKEEKAGAKFTTVAHGNNLKMAIMRGGRFPALIVSLIRYNLRNFLYAPNWA
jgi:hypothetical protein